MLKKLGFKKLSRFASEDYIDAHIPFSEKKKLYKADVTRYAERSPASAVANIGTGAAIGGILGAGFKANPKVIAAGAGIGALLGRWNQTSTDKETADAKDLLRGGDAELRKALL
ncbi:hypothetical protein CL614_03710 [archaeon]|jgi:hypothetical protein|nr:hypothetical protein [archaeon]|tara:strand:+ start:93 stop:434 length:342 start_codon:yes stop_codon:yes gene_type:complete